MASSLAASAKISLLIALSRVLGLVREMVFAALFGAGAAADAFLVAFRIPNLLRDLLAEGALSAAFVPTFTQVWSGGDPRAAFLLVNRLLAWLTLGLAALVASVVAFPSTVVELISDGFGGDLRKVQLCADLTSIVMPYLICVVVAALWMGVLNAQEKYVLPAAVSLSFNAVSIATGGLLLMLGGDTQQQIAWWAWGTLAAGVVQPLMLLPTLMRQGYRPVLTFRGSLADPGVRRVARQMLPALLSAAALQVNVIVNTSLASALGDGPVAYLSYAFRIFFLPVGMFGVALATVTTTRISSASAKGDSETIARGIREAKDAVWVLMLASSLVLVGLAEPICAVLFERGAFDAEQSLATAAVLRAYGLALIPYGMVKVLVPIFYAFDRPRTALIASLAAIVCNIGFNLWIVDALGAVGLALGTAIGSLVNASILALAMRGLVSKAAPPGRLRAWSVLVVAALMLGSVIGLGVAADAWIGEHVEVSVTWARLAALGVTLAVGAGLYLGVLSWGRHPCAEGLNRLTARVVAKLRRR
jgi:putative peptidoglycan lipid II flippase